MRIVHPVIIKHTDGLLQSLDTILQKTLIPFHHLSIYHCPWEGQEKEPLTNDYSPP